MNHSQKVTDQAALTTSSGRSWLVIGGLLTLLCGVLLVAMHVLKPPGLALAGAAVVLALYVALVIVRFAVPGGRPRLTTMAILTILIPITFVICGWIIMVTEGTI